MYWNWSGKRGRTANASFASRMHNLEFSGVVDQQAKDTGERRVTDMCVMPSDFKVSSDLDA